MPRPHQFDELEVPRVDDAQAAAIGRLTVSFNFLEFCVNAAISLMFHSNEVEEINALIGRMRFQEKIERLNALVEVFERNLKMLTAGKPHPDQIEERVAEILSWWPELQKELCKAAAYRNSLIHCQVDLPIDNQRARLRSRSGVELSGSPEEISREARRFGALGNDLSIFAGDFWSTNRILKKRQESSRGSGIRSWHVPKLSTRPK